VEPRRRAGRRRLVRRLRDATRLRSWPAPLRAITPFPFGRSPRDRCDLPSLPRVLEWRRGAGMLRLLRLPSLEGAPPDLGKLG